MAQRGVGPPLAASGHVQVQSHQKGSVGQLPGEQGPGDEGIPSGQVSLGYGVLVPGIHLPLQVGRAPVTPPALHHSLLHQSCNGPLDS